MCRPRLAFSLPSSPRDCADGEAEASASEGEARGPPPPHCGRAASPTSCSAPPTGYLAAVPLALRPRARSAMLSSMTPADESLRRAPLQTVRGVTRPPGLPARRRSRHWGTQLTLETACGAQRASMGRGALEKGRRLGELTSSSPGAALGGSVAPHRAPQPILWAHCDSNQVIRAPGRGSVGVTLTKRAYEGQQHARSPPTGELNLQKRSLFCRRAAAALRP